MTHRATSLGYRQHEADDSPAGFIVQAKMQREVVAKAGHTHPSPPNLSSALRFVFPAPSVVGLPACLFFRSRFAVGLGGRVHIVYSSCRVISPLWRLR